MARDYAKKHSKKSLFTSSTRSQRTPGWVWLLTGLLIGLFASGLIYISSHSADSKDPQLTTITKAQRDTVKRNKTKDLANKESIVEQKAEKTPQKKRFEFYTMLANMEVPIDPLLKSPNKNQVNKTIAQPAARNMPATKQNLPNPVAKSNMPDMITQPSISASTKLRDINQSATKIRDENDGIDSALPQHPKKAAPTPTNTNAEIPEVKPKIVNAQPASMLVQVGSFSDSKDADRLKASLILQGYQANIKKSNHQTQTLYRVYMGPYTNRAEAMNTLTRLKSEQINAILIEDNRPANGEDIAHTED
jgi:cell division protein FtsN